MEILNQSSGSFRGWALFRVPANASGVLIQQVTIGSDKPYYEGELVTNGVVLIPTDSTGSSWGLPRYYNDIFFSPVATTISGLIQFYPGTQLSDFPNLIVGSVGPQARDLPASYDAPTGWTLSGAVPHLISVTGASGMYRITACQPGPCHP
jgi:hypothetical protein